MDLAREPCRSRFLGRGCGARYDILKPGSLGAREDRSTPESDVWRGSGSKEKPQTSGWVDQPSDYLELLTFSEEPQLACARLGFSSLRVTSGSDKEVGQPHVFVCGPQNPDTDVPSSLSINADLPVHLVTETVALSTGKTIWYREPTSTKCCYILVDQLLEQEYISTATYRAFSAVAPSGEQWCLESETLVRRLDRYVRHSPIEINEPNVEHRTALLRR